MKNKESLKHFQYRRIKEERAGHNYAYYSDEFWEKLEKKGYYQHRFKNKYYTGNECEAKKIVSEYKKQGNYSRIICIKNKLRIRDYMVIFKPRLILDPDADGKQWKYKNCLIIDQTHPKLKKYMCYQCDKKGEIIKNIESCSSLTEAKEIIDNYILT